MPAYRVAASIAHTRRPRPSAATRARTAAASRHAGCTRMRLRAPVPLRRRHAALVSGILAHLIEDVAHQLHHEPIAGHRHRGRTGRAVQATELADQLAVIQAAEAALVIEIAGTVRGNDGGGRAGG